MCVCVCVCVCVFLSVCLCMCIRCIDENLNQYINKYRYMYIERGREIRRYRYDRKRDMKNVCVNRVNRIEHDSLKKEQTFSLV